MDEVQIESNSREVQNNSLVSQPIRITLQTNKSITNSLHSFSAKSNVHRPVFIPNINKSRDAIRSPANDTNLQSTDSSGPSVTIPRDSNSNGFVLGRPISSSVCNSSETATLIDPNPSANDRINPIPTGTNSVHGHAPAPILSTASSSVVSPLDSTLGFSRAGALSSSYPCDENTPYHSLLHDSSEGLYQGGLEDPPFSFLEHDLLRSCVEEAEAVEDQQQIEGGALRGGREPEEEVLQGGRGKWHQVTVTMMLYLGPLFNAYCECHIP